MRDAFQDAESTPPKGLWERIAEQDIAPRKTALSETQMERLKIVAFAIIGTVLGIAITQLFNHQSQNSPKNKSIVTAEVESTTPHEAVTEATAINEPSLQETAQTERIQHKAETPNPSEEKSIGNPNAHSQLMSIPQSSVPTAQPVAQTVATPSHPNNTPNSPTEPKQNAIARTSITAPVPTNETQPVVASTETKAPLIQEEPQPEELFIPNLITPNGDGINDTWSIPIPEGYGTVAVKIFSSNSHLVYSNNNYDGSFRGEGCKAGNYFYILTIKEKNIVRRGVLIIKDR